MRPALVLAVLSTMVLHAPAGLAAEAVAAPAPPSARISPNTLVCADWIHNPDGSWTAGVNMHPFDLGTATNQMVVNWTVVANKEFYGGYDLWVALNQKCG